MIEFQHSDVGLIRCPYHNKHESFTAGTIIQPTNPALVRYPCGYVDGLAEASPGIEPAFPEPSLDALIQELSNRLRRLEERPYSRPNVPKVESRPASPSQEPTILGTYSDGSTDNRK